MVACEPPFIIAQVAEENVESLTEMFFQTANAYLTMVRDSSRCSAGPAVLMNAIMCVQVPCSTGCG